MSEIIKNIIIGVIALISTAIIIIYIIFHKIINCTLFQVFLNLSYSYLAAFIFYIAQVIIPNSIKKQKAKLLLQSNIYSLYEQLYFFACFVEEVIDFDNEDIAIKGIDNDIVYYNLYLNGKVEINYVNFREYFGSFDENIKSAIKRLQSNYNYQYLPSKLINIISNIEIENFSVISSISDLYPLCKEYQNLEYIIDKIKKYSTELSVFSTKKIEYKFKLLNENEKEKYKSNIHKNKPIHDVINETIKKNQTYKKS